MSTKLTSPANDQDRAFFERELDSFLPDRIFDAHAHLMKEGTHKFNVKGTPATTGYDEYQFFMRDIHTRRHTAALFLPGFSADMKDKLPEANAWMGEQTAKGKDCVGAFFVCPEDDPEWVRQEVRRLKLHGLKCYHVMSPTKPTFEAEIPNYLPERLVKVAHEEGWFITLHMVKRRAVADPGNQHWIRHYCKNYPNMKLILAHSARGFEPAHNLEGLETLKGLDNVYFDSSANCESIAHQSIMRILGHKRLMYGSDFQISHLRGRSLAINDYFIWLYEQTPVWGDSANETQPVLVGLEHLRSMKWACWAEKLSDKEVEDVFWNNGAELFGLK